MKTSLNPAQAQLVVERLNHFVRHQRMSIGDLAEQTGTTRATASRWLSGKVVPSDEALWRIGLLLGFDPAELYSDVEFVQVIKKPGDYSRYAISATVEVSYELGKELAPLLLRAREEARETRRKLREEARALEGIL